LTNKDGGVKLISDDLVVVIHQSYDRWRAHFMIMIKIRYNSWFDVSCGGR